MTITISNDSTSNIAIDQDYSYRVVVALNNAGVTLVQRRMYLEAIATFKDAVRFMSSAFFSRSDNDRPPKRLDLDIALQAAWQRTSITQQQQQEKHDPSTIGVQHGVVIVSDRQSPHEIRCKMLGTAKVLYCVTIDPIESFTDCDDMLVRLESESAILLYNYGVAYKCLAKATEMSSMVHNENTLLFTRGDHAFRTAFQIMELAKSISVKLLLSSSSCDTTNLSVTPTNILLVSLLVTETLVQMSACHLWNQYDDDDDDNDRLYNVGRIVQFLDIVLTAISEREMFSSMEGSTQSAATAA
jgi:hypothetical protein